MFFDKEIRERSYLSLVRVLFRQWRRKSRKFETAMPLFRFARDRLADVLRTRAFRCRDGLLRVQLVHGTTDQQTPFVGQKPDRTRYIIENLHAL